MNFLLNKTVITLISLALLLSYAVYQTNRANNKAEALDIANKNIEEMANSHANELILVRDISYAEGQAIASKKAVVKHSNNLKKVIEKRGEIKDEKDSNFIIYSF